MTTWTCDFNLTDWPNRSGNYHYIQSTHGTSLNTVWGVTNQASYGPGGEETIIGPEANRSGSAGNGMRRWKWGVNGLSMGADIEFATALGASPTEYWLRTYVRFESGFRWEGDTILYDKWHYINWNQADTCFFGLGYGNAPDGKDAWSFEAPDATKYPSDLSWYASMGNSNLGDGQWHCMEYHIKRGTTTGEFGFWWDGVQYANYTGIDTGTAAFISAYHSNQNEIASASGPHYIDTDDYAVSDSGYIGPLSSGSYVAERSSPIILG